MAHIGIDLGTTNSLVSVFIDGQARVLENELGESMTPSVVAVDETGAVLVGRAARDYLIRHPDRGMACFKRDMGTNKTYTFGKKKWSPIELSALILKEMKRIAEQSLGEDIETAVISVPAYFHDGPRQATLDAAKIAGLKVNRLINEPTAAALAYGCQNQDADSTLMVFDLGGGTFDVTILEIFEQIIDVKASGGISRLGGEDYLEHLIEYLADKLGISEDIEERAKLRTRAELLKRALSEKDSVDFEFNNKKLTVTRKDFADISKELTDRLRPVVIRCLRDAQVSFEEVEAVILVGGASRMSVVTDLVQGFGGRNILDDIDQDRVVALGAAVQAALAKNDEAIKDVVLTDVAPHSLGISISREVRPNQFEDGIFSPIIDRNSTLPISRSHVYTTISPMSDEIELKIYQGEHRYTKDNHLLGTFMVKGMRAKPGQEHAGLCEVRFTYDMSGVIEVEATVLATNKKANLIIEERPGQLSPAELEKAIKRLQPLKVKLRDLLPNRARIERALILYEELNGAYREHLEQLLGQFEMALESQDEQAVTWTAKALDQYLEQFFEKQSGHLHNYGDDLEQEIEQQEQLEKNTVSGPHLDDQEEPDQ